MEKSRLRNLALGFFAGAAGSFLSTLVEPGWLAIAVVVGLVLLFGGLGSYFTYLIWELSGTTHTSVEEPHRV